MRRAETVQIDFEWARNLALTTGTLALPPLVIEGLAEFNGSFDRLVS
jgi:hypothetical protein